QPLPLLPGPCPGNPEVGPESPGIQLSAGDPREILEGVEIEEGDPGVGNIGKRMCWRCFQQLRKTAPVGPEKLGKELSDDGSSDRRVDVSARNFPILTIEREQTVFEVVMSLQLRQSRLVAQGAKVPWREPLRRCRLPGGGAKGERKDAVAGEAVPCLQGHALKRFAVQTLDRVAIDRGQGDGHGALLTEPQ